jgi:hypothetical protein
MTQVSNQNIECPSCLKNTAHTDVNIDTNERMISCDDCGFYAETEIIERNGWKFWKSVTERRIYDNGTVMTNVLNSERDSLRQIAGENFEPCDCVVDLEDGSTITACEKHPQGGSPKGKYIWSR